MFTSFNLFLNSFMTLYKARVIIYPNDFIAYKIQFETGLHTVQVHALEIINFLLFSESCLNYKKTNIQCIANIPLRDKM